MSLQKIRERAIRLRLDALALGLAVGHSRTPWYAKVLVAGLVAYVVTPVDLVPDEGTKMRRLTRLAALALWGALIALMVLLGFYAA